MTFYHHVEEMKRVPYRYFKDFTAPYINREGIEAMRTYQMYVRDLDRGVEPDLNPMGELLWAGNLYQGHRPMQGWGLRVIRAQTMFSFVAAQIDENKALGLLYRINKQGVKAA